MTKVYFIRPVGMLGPIKIGCGGSPKERRAMIEQASPFRLEIIAEVDGDRLLEFRLHAEFLETHSHGEWFHWSQRLEDTITELARGAFDKAKLPHPIILANLKNGPRTETQKIQLTYALQASCAQKRTGFYAPMLVSGMAQRNDPGEIGAFELYLSDPEKYGVKGMWDAKSYRSSARKPKVRK